jgi:anhydro-N-acetylmuramic acid kinase
MQMTTYDAIGLMSGTSLDGLDIAYCKFEQSSNQKWKWKIIDCETVTYPVELISQLRKAKSLDGLSLSKLDVELGKWMGTAVKDFINKFNLKIDFIASHGHTVFHLPENQLTLQIGNPNFIHAICECPVISDFRTLDMAKGGQGAPLVPIGDELLFSEYDFCINLGGIANLSYQNTEQKRIAYDICACNILLNTLANIKGLEYDDRGKIAKSGKIITRLLETWNSFSFIKQAPPKSLGIELIEPEMLSKIDSNQYSIEDMLSTAIEHIAEQISTTISSAKVEGKILLTGGGAFNDYLIDRIKNKLNANFELIVADQKVVNYKEALIFAFLGVLNVKNTFNVMSSVTGAHSNSVTGQKLGDI